VHHKFLQRSQDISSVVNVSTKDSTAGSCSRQLSGTMNFNVLWYFVFSVLQSSSLLQLSSREMIEFGYLTIIFCWVWANAIIYCVEHEVDTFYSRTLLLVTGHSSSAIHFWGCVNAARGGRALGLFFGSFSHLFFAFAIIGRARSNLLWTWWWTTLQFSLNSGCHWRERAAYEYYYGSLINCFNRQCFANQHEGFTLTGFVS
jgi:hypothetical protein